MKIRILGLLVAVACFAVSGCTIRLGGFEGGPDYRGAPRLSSVEEKKEYILGYEILDERGTLVDPKAPDGTRPFAVMFAIGEGQMGNCSGTHISRGKVVLNRHCVAGDSNAKNYFFLYFSKEGRKRVIQAEDIAYVARNEKFDVAVFDIKSQDADTWDTAENTLMDTSSFIGADATKPENRFDVQAWAFDPGHNYADIVSSRRNDEFFVFRQKNCVASKKMPKVVYHYSSGSKRDVEDISLDEASHLFLDQCDSRIVPGNSGSLLSLRGKFEKKVGVLQAYMPVREQDWPFLSKVVYQGNGTTEQEFRSPFDKVQLFGIGTDLYHVLNLELEKIFLKY